MRSMVEGPTTGAGAWGKPPPPPFRRSPSPDGEDYGTEIYPFTLPASMPRM